MASLVDDAHLRVDRDDEAIMGSRRTGGNSRSDGVGVEGVLEYGHHAREHGAVLGTVNARRCAPPADAAFGH
jgi:hypothetical protein